MADFIIIGIIVACIAGAVFYRIKLKKSGESGCGCSGCGSSCSSGSCGDGIKTEK